MVKNSFSFKLLGRPHEVNWSVSDFSALNIPEDLKGFGVCVNVKDILISDKASSLYQEVSAAHELLCMVDPCGLSCAEIERAIFYSDIIPPERREEIALQRLRMFRAATEFNKDDEVCCQKFSESITMLKSILAEN